MPQQFPTHSQLKTAEGSKSNVSQGSKSRGEIPKLCMCHMRCQSRKSCTCKASGRLCQQGCHPGHTCVNGECKNNGVLDLTTQSAPQTYTQNSLTKHYKATLESNSWLDDQIVKATQDLLKRTYPAVKGLQPPSLGEMFAMEPQPFEFVQVLNNHKNH